MHPEANAAAEAVHKNYGHTVWLSVGTHGPNFQTVVADVDKETFDWCFDVFEYFQLDLLNRMFVRTQPIERVPIPIGKSITYYKRRFNIFIKYSEADQYLHLYLVFIYVGNFTQIWSRRTADNVIFVIWHFYFFC